MKQMIVTERLTKRYDNTQAVKDLNLEVSQGETFGFLGPNGAGKTTTIRMLTTLTRPTSGCARINGFDVVQEPMLARKEFGVAQQHLSLDWEMTVWEILELHAGLHHLKRNERQQRISELLDHMDLARQSNLLVNKLSEGMKRRLMIARSLLHRPKMLFLDEPTVGLDAQARRYFWEMIRGMNADGTTIFLTTHYIEEAEALCQRVGIMYQGRLIVLGSPPELRQRLGPICVEVLLNNLETRNRYFPDRAAANDYLQRVPVDAKTATVRESNLEDVFMELTGQKVGDG